MAFAAEKMNKKDSPEQIVDYSSGNELAAKAISQLNFHLMGYYPITPSTEVAEVLDEMKADGEHEMVMIPGDGEHGAAGISYGASTTGARVFNCTSANGLLYAIEQLPVQSHTRFPMVLDVVNRSYSGPLDIRCDHSDLMMTLNLGWIILLAKDPQAAYDMNILAVKISEHQDIRLPAIVSYDGFFTSHQKRRVSIFANKEDVQNFVGRVEAKYISVDPRRPVTIGAYMNDPDLINNRKQLSLAMEKAYELIPGMFKEYASFSGRSYNIVENYKTEDAEVILVVLNSAVDTAKIAVDELRARGQKVGLFYPNLLRPFPSREVRKYLSKAKVVIIGDREDAYSGMGGNLSMMIKSAMQDVTGNNVKILSRVYGLGGREFFVEDAVTMLKQGLDFAKSGGGISYDYIGADTGEGNFISPVQTKPFTKAEINPGLISVEKDEATGKLKVKGVMAKNLTAMPKRIACGHGACPGCGIFPNIDTFMKGIEGDVVMLWHTGCGMIVTTGYPATSFNITYIHNLFQNGAATLAGVVEAFRERRRRGELSKDDDITFIMVTGDGGLDIGLGPALGTAFRNHKMIILEYDNEGYMNTGHQLSFTTPLGHATSTSHVGKAQTGKQFHHKDSAQLFAATNIPYVFTGSDVQYRDLITKAAKAQWYARNEGLVFGKLFSACPLNWRTDDKDAHKVIQAAIDCNFFPLYEVEKGVTTLNYDPESKGKKIPAIEWLKLMGKSRHLAGPDFVNVIERFQIEVDRRFARIKAMSEHPFL